jgi:hypothetical protein
MSTGTYTVTLTGRQVAELCGILLARQDMCRRMVNTKVGPKFGTYWPDQVKALEDLRVAVSEGVATSARARHA